MDVPGGRRADGVIGSPGIKNAKQIDLFRPDVSGRFLFRENRFVIRALLPDGNEARVHAPNPGRLQELYIPGTRVILERSLQHKRKLPLTLAAMEHRGQWVPMVSAAANLVAGELILPELYPEGEISREVSRGSHRFDFSVREGDRRQTYLEVKSCSLVESGLGLFPDAPSTRATGHVNALAEMADSGDFSAAIVFVVSHSEPEFFAPNYHNDLDFARALRHAGKTGVEVLIRSSCSDDQGRTRLSDATQPKLLIDRIEKIIVADSGWLLRCARGGGDSWVFDMRFYGHGFENQYAIAQRKSPSVKHIIPLRSPAAADLEREFAEGILELETGSNEDGDPDGEIRPLIFEPGKGASWAFRAYPLEHRGFNRLLFSLRHRRSKNDLLAASPVF